MILKNENFTKNKYKYDNINYYLRRISGKLETSRENKHTPEVIRQKASDMYTKCNKIESLIEESNYAEAFLIIPSIQAIDLSGCFHGCGSCLTLKLFCRMFWEFRECINIRDITDNQYEFIEGCTNSITDEYTEEINKQEQNLDGDRFHIDYHF